MLSLAPATASLRRASPALVGYVAVRGFALAVLAVWAHLAEEDAGTLLSGRWDAVWYRRIAEDGYGFVLQVDADTVHPDYAFFPLFPLLMRAVAGVTPLDPATAGLLLSWLSSLVAAWGIFAVGETVGGRRTGVVLAVLWGALPIAFVESMAYTESMFTAFCAWALSAVLAGRWTTAGALAIAAGLTRPAAVALIAAIGLAAVVTIVRAWREVRRRDCLPPLLGAALSPLGFLAFVGWVAIRTGSVTGYFDVQAAWGKSLDLGQATVRQVWAELTGPMPWVGVVVVLAIAGVLALLAWSLARRPPLALAVFTVGIVALALLGTGYFNSRPRLLLPAFPFLLPVAERLARARPAAAAAVVGALTVASAFYGGYMLVVGQAPP